MAALATGMRGAEPKPAEEEAGEHQKPQGLPVGQRPYAVNGHGKDCIPKPHHGSGSCCDESEKQQEQTESPVWSVQVAHYSRLFNSS